MEALLANTQAICSSFKTDLLTGQHNFGVGVIRAGTTADSFKGALYFASGSLGATTTAYGTTSEVTGTGYTAGGNAITNATPPSLSGTTGVWTPSGAVSWAGLTAAAFDTMLLYNSSQSNKAVAVYTFGSQSITAGTLTINMPVNVAATALIQLA